MMRRPSKLSEGRKYIMHTRQNALNKWLKSILGQTPYTLWPLAGDASFRRYFRLQYEETTKVVMDAPPDKETITPFINIANQLAAIGIHTPAIEAMDDANGFLLLEDLGDALLLGILSRDNANILYKAAITTLLKLQKCPHVQLPPFNRAFMLKEISLFREWFLQAYLGLNLHSTEENLLNETFNWLTSQIATQPQVFIHRDYHSRNLLVIDPKSVQDIGVIDFQDAMSGPFTYDIVSLLKDCYIQWPREQVLQWLSQYYENQPLAEHYSFQDFTRAFDLCGLQRHLKVLGIFCRLHLRDNKPNYLRDLPLTFNYVTACLESYTELQPLYHFIEQKVKNPAHTLFEKTPS